MLDNPGAANTQLSQAQAQQLQSALNKPPIGAPQPPGGVKRDVPNPILLDYRRLRVAIERALENESDPAFEQVLHAMHLAMEQRESGSSGMEIMQLMVSAMQPAAPPGASMQGPPPQATPGGPPQIGMGPQA